MVTSGHEVSERDVHERLHAAAAAVFGNFVNQPDNNSMHFDSIANVAPIAPHLSSSLDNLLDQCSTASEKLDNCTADIVSTAPHLSSMDGPLQDLCSTATEMLDNVHGSDHAVVVGPNSDTPPPDGPWGSRRGACVAESIQRWNQSPPQARVTFASPELLANGTASAESSDHDDFDKEMSLFTSPDSQQSTAASNADEHSPPGIGAVESPPRLVDAEAKGSMASPAAPDDWDRPAPVSMPPDTRAMPSEWVPSQALQPVAKCANSCCHLTANPDGPRRVQGFFCVPCEAVIQLLEEEGDSFDRDAVVEGLDHEEHMPSF